MAKSEMTKAMEAIADKLVGVNVTELPAVSASDNGKVLMVVEGKWAAAAIPSQLPAVTASDEGDVLKVNSSGEWTNGAIMQELPEVSSTDAGKVLTVNNSGEWAAAALPGG